jgi:cyanophycinase-like exopeptidase
MRKGRFALAVALVLSCSLDQHGDLATPTPLPPEGRDKAAPGIASDGGEVDASATPLDGASDAHVPVQSGALVIYPRQGVAADDARAAVGPGLVLDGGYGALTVLTWMHDTAVGGGGGSGGAPSGDVVVLTSGGGDSAGGFLSASFASAQTLSLVDGATPDDFALAADIVSRAEAVWFTGGDQAKYVHWKGTALMAAVDGVYARGGVVGGSSAGMIILGQSVNDALLTISENITTPLAVHDPYDPVIHFTQDMLHFAPLRRAITDPHFIARDRMGRLATFMARQVADGFATPDVLGVGVQDGAALVIDAHAQARLLASFGSAAYVVSGRKPDVAIAGQPLVYKGLHVVKLGSAAHGYDFARRCGHGLVRDFDLDGAQSPPYPATVYDDGPLVNECD